MPTADLVALYFIHKATSDQDGQGISNLKLQKLLYYAKGFHQALFDQPLFKEQLEAWTHGPVVPSIYHKYKSHAASPITERGNAGQNLTDIFTEEQIDLLEEIWTVFGQFSAWKLRDMSHQEKPWLDHEKDASAIDDRELGAYFKTRLKAIG